MRVSQIAVLGALCVVTAAQSYVTPGPNMLNECPCDAVYTAMVKCQSAGNNAVRDCVCIPNPHGWYPWVPNCRACLSGNDFFTNLGNTMTQLLTSCTQPGGGITSDGKKICASNSGFEYCVSFKDGSRGQSSWSSFVKFGGERQEHRNGTQVL